MLVKIVTKKRFKVIAMFLAVNLLAQIGFPTVAFALTSGPSQPEMGSFEPVNTNQMVDLFSGDFTYNISLMNVPGPNGGYPINLAYNAGIGMEQEASWVGLGWNINAGVINRNLRGIPDDFSGDKVSKTLNMRPQRKLSFGFEAVNTELFGFDSGKGFGVSAQVSLYYDNYKGVGLNYGIDFSTKSADAEGGPMQASLSITSDTKEGLGFSPSVSYAGQIKKKGFAFETGLNFNSRQGLNSITFRLGKKKYTGHGSYLGGSGTGSGMSFSSSTYVPMMDMPRGGFYGDFNFKMGADLAGVDPSFLNFNVRYSENRILNEIMEFGGYGYLYAQNNTEGHNIADFNREKDIPVNKNSKSLPVPSATYDVFAIKGQGVGGAFRTYRSDVGVFKDPKINSVTGGGGLGLELNTSPATLKFGWNPKITVNTSYSGGWQTHAQEVEQYYNFQGETDNDLYEPSYFKALGELTPSQNMGGGIQNTTDSPFRFDVKMVPYGLTSVPTVRNFVSIANSSQQVNALAKTSARETRVQSVEYLTKKEKSGNYYSSNIVNQTYPTLDYYAVTAPSTSAEDHHIGEISVVNPDGNRYVYDLPAYNIHQEDVMFSVDGGDVINIGRMRTYNTSENDRDNNKGLTNLYSKTIMPPYAHSYLLTQVLSPDYVDLTGDGPTKDDLGYWVKFNYIKRTSFSWRAPYEQNKGNNIENNYSDNMDDMSGYSYGEKEIMYLQSIETKTHLAEYYLSERLDGLGSAGINGGQGSEKLLKLDSIVLRSKAELTKAIKTVHFEYDYILCEGTPNSLGTNGAKLTLTKVWFTYLDNTNKGVLSPYEFIYADVDHDGTEDAEANPDYNVNLMDRWGNYQKEGPFSNTTGFVSPDQQYSYCNQFDSYTNRDVHASAWNLTKIIMPSGGELNINYEADDYAYVQNKKAMQMFKMLGTGNTSLQTSAPLSNDDNRIYFELDKSVVDQSELNQCIEGVTQVYFKAYMKLKNYHETSTPAYDYVEGYAEIDKSKGIVSATGAFPTTSAYIEVKNVPPHQVIQSEVHPIKMAGLREIRFNRSDLLSGQNTGVLSSIGSLAAIVSVVPTVLTTVLDAMQMLSGFYNYGIMAGWCNKIEITNDAPSYIRLNNSNGFKYGGGCRVKAIDLNDGWQELNNANYESSSYGQIYDYTIKENGKTISSGVAQYEPLIGGEENPFRQPVRYSSDRIIVKDEALMVEEPFNESLYPSADVGYSRITVRNKTQKVGTDKIKKAVSGITVHEFYTARDFPVFTKNTNVDYVGYNVAIPIPFIGGYNHHNNGYSQGYSIELNNMHGKPYSQQTYIMPINPLDPDNPTDPHDPMPGDPGVEPIAANYYYYKTQEPFVRHKSTGNKLDNEVAVLSGDALISSMEIGKHVDTYVDMRENKTTSNTLELLPNVNAALFYIVGTLVPAIDNSYSMFRSVTTNKVITRNGILDKQVTFKDGARVTQQNVYYDTETGSPLLATTTNDFDKPIYDYTYAAHWEHEGMQGAYKNVGAKVTPAGGASIIKSGDELLSLSSGNRYWVEPDGTLTNAAGQNVGSFSSQSGTFKIIRSGYKNQQSVPMGKIISLTNPLTERVFPMFTAINNFNISTLPARVFDGYVLIGDLGFNDCLNNKVYDGITVAISPANRLVINSDASYNKICGGGETNDAFIVFDPSVNLTSPSSFDVTTMILTKYGNSVKAVDGNGKTIWGELLNAECLNECLDGVLHASATKFSSSWNINYADAGVVYPTGHPNVGSTPPSNTVRYGAENIWRTDKSYVFNIDRKQTPSATQTGIDGTYQSFGLFSWDPLAPLDKWVKTNQINQYSPYGFELENQDALGIKSAALYGYSNSLVTAVASNTEYRELVFDGFEDYGSYSYANPSSNYGHFQLDAATITTDEAHTGKASIAIADNNNIEFSNSITTPIAGKFWPKASTTYYFSAWVKVADNSTTATLTVDATPIASTSPHNQKIEGWQRLEGKFTTGSSTIDIAVSATGGTVYIDDVRIQPFKSAMKTFVYDPLTLWLKAELDERNYATFYNYDEEGNVVQIKKETKEGIRTITSNRKNVKQNQP